MPSVLAYGVALAVADSSKKTSGGSPIILIVLLGFVVLLYFFVLRPRSQRQRQAREEVRKVQVGDEVATIGGLVGTIVSEDGDRVTISTGSGTELVYLRQAIGRRLTPPQAEPEPAGEPDQLTGPPPGFENPATPADGSTSTDETETS